MRGKGGSVERVWSLQELIGGVEFVFSDARNALNLRQGPPLVEALE